MSKKKLNFSLLDKLTICAGIGKGKRICTMQAANLLGQIAEGKITLKEALEGDIYPEDKLDCVHPELNYLCITINDSLETDKQRKTFAKKYLPQIVGTRGTAKQNAKIDAAIDKAEQGLEDEITEENAKVYKNKLAKLVAKYLKTYNVLDFSLAEEIRDTADEIVDVLEKDIDLDDYTESLDIYMTRLEAGIACANKIKGKRK